jgi:carboxyl-terminal processing protease
MRLVPIDGCRRVLVTAVGLVFAVLAVGCSAPPAPPAQADGGGHQVPACPRPASPGQPLTHPPPITATTVATLGQAYSCVLDNWADGATLDDRVLITGAFAGLTQELQRRGLDQATAMLPALTSNHDGDWASAGGVFQRVVDALPADPQVRQAVLAAAMTGLVASLHDDHVSWVRSFGGSLPSLGVITSVQIARPDAVPPLFITAVEPGSPAAAAGLQPGDILTTVNGVAPFENEQLNTGALTRVSDIAAYYSGAPPSPDPVLLDLHRPSTGRDWSVALTPSLVPRPPPVTATVLNGDMAEVKLTAFGPNAAAMLFTTITNLHLGDKLKGVILDLRGNGGGSPTEVSRLLGGFVHDKVWGFDVDRNGVRTAHHTDDTIALIHQPLVVLTDRDCVSACDSFSDAVKDLHVGSLVGARTAGDVAGPALPYLLNDGSLLGVPSAHTLGANGEIIDGIGVAPDYNAPVTPQALSTGHDPTVDKALSLLGH